MSSDRPLRALVLAALAALAADPGLAAARRPNTTAGVRPAAPPARPDAALYREARAAEERLRASGKRMAKRSEWESVVLRYRKLVARYPRSGYCDNALLAVGNLYRDMARRFRLPRCREEAVAAYRSIVSEYPSSSLGEEALFQALEIARGAGDRRTLTETARAYLDTYPEGRRAAKVKALMRRQEPSTPLPSPPPPGLASVFDLRAWSGESSTRVVIDLERKVPIQSDRAQNPDRLWVDLVGTRLHPNLAQRVFPVGDGLLEKVRIGKNREDVVRVVLDFKEVWEHQVFYLENPTRLVIDVRGEAHRGPSPSTAALPPGAGPSPASATAPAAGLATPAAASAAVPAPGSAGQAPQGAPPPAEAPGMVAGRLPGPTATLLRAGTPYRSQPGPTSSTRSRSIRSNSASMKR